MFIQITEFVFFLEIQLLVHLGLPLLFPVHLPLSSLMYGPAQSEYYCSPLSTPNSTTS